MLLPLLSLQRGANLNPLPPPCSFPEPNPSFLLRPIRPGCGHTLAWGLRDRLLILGHQPLCVLIVFCAHDHLVLRSKSNIGPPARPTWGVLPLPTPFVVAVLFLPLPTPHPNTASTAQPPPTPSRTLSPFLTP